MSFDLLELFDSYIFVNQEQATVFSRTRLAFGLVSFKYYTEQTKFPVCD